jgi:putative RNA 2'-phosphotransferase
MMPDGIAMSPPWCSLHWDHDATTSDFNERMLRTISYALRHNPQQYFLEMDRNGWVDIEHLALALRYEHPDYAQVTTDSLRTIAENSALARFEIVGNRIRALYGHSITEIDRADSETPPSYLFHGTLGECVPSILKDGLLPMERSCVHLTLDWRYAHSVAQAKSLRPVVLSNHVE